MKVEISKRVRIAVRMKYKLYHVKSSERLVPRSSILARRLDIHISLIYWLLSIAAGGSIWVYVQGILIPYQKADAVARNVPRGNSSDLYPRWLGARELLLRGRDPYGDDITREIQYGYYGRPIDPARPNDPKDQQAFAYPLYVVFVLAPTVKLSFPLVQRAFMVFLILLTVVSIPLWLRTLGWKLSPSAQLLWIVLMLGSFPAIQGFKLQQLTLLVAGLLAASLTALATGYVFLAGVLLALASIKPQLVALPGIVLVIWAPGNWPKRQRFVWGLALTMLLLVVGAELLLPGWIPEFRAASAAYWRYTGGGRSVLDVELSARWGHVVSAALVVLLLFWAWRLRRSEAGTPDFNWLLALTFSTTLAVIPMFAPYNQVLLVPVFMVIVRTIREQWNSSRLARFLVAITGISLFWPWLAAAGLVVALLFLPTAEVQKGWLAPLFTNFAIPTATLGLVLLNARTIRRSGSSA